MKPTSITVTGSVSDFDLSDVTVQEPDTLDDVLAIAAEVLAEYGEDRAPTRIRRLAEWLVMNVGGEPHQTEPLGQGLCERYRVHHTAYQLVRVGGIFAVENGSNGCPHTPIAVGTEAARAFAVAILRSCEREY